VGALAKRGREVLSRAFAFLRASCTTSTVPPPLYRRLQAVRSPRRLKSAVRGVHLFFCTASPVPPPSGGVFPTDASLRYRAARFPRRLKSAVQVHSLFFCTATPVPPPSGGVFPTQPAVQGGVFPSQTEVCGTRRASAFLYRRPCTAAFRRCVPHRRKSAVQSGVFPRRLKSAVQDAPSVFCTATPVPPPSGGAFPPQSAVQGGVFPSQTKVCGTRRASAFLYRIPCTAAFRRCVPPTACGTRRCVPLAD